MMNEKDLSIRLAKKFMRVLIHFNEQNENDYADKTKLDIDIKEVNQGLKRLWDILPEDEKPTVSPMQITVKVKASASSEMLPTESSEAVEIPPTNKVQEIGKAAEVANMAQKSGQSMVSPRAANLEDVDIHTDEVAHVSAPPTASVSERNMDAGMSVMPKRKPAVVAKVIKKEITRKQLPKHANKNKFSHAYQSQNEFRGLFYCKCENEFFGPERFRNHLFNYNKDEQFYCDYCDCRFPHISLLIDHLKKNKPIRSSTRLAKKLKREPDIVEK